MKQLTKIVIALGLAASTCTYAKVSPEEAAKLEKALKR